VTTGSPHPPLPDERDWLALVDGALLVAEASAWVVQPDCGAVVTFTGTVRNHAEGVTGVTHLVYEAYEEQAVAKLSAVADGLRARWPGVARVALIHRVGEVPLGEPAVVVAVSAPHRDEAFEAARFAIDTLKATVPIWKQEHGDAGGRWGTGAQPVRSLERSATPMGRPA
jgi:molybdopterin synthase catalytic subunit